MRILLLNQFFWPDAAATSQLLTDLAREMSARGHEVHAVCADSGYAGNSAGDAPPVRVHRVRSLPFQRGALGRVLSYMSFFCGAIRHALSVGKPDLVLTLTTPPLLPLLGSMVKLTRGSRHFIWEMDVYPDVAVSLRYFRPGGLRDRATGLLADSARHYANGIVALGECMKERLVARGIAAERIAIADNWADAAAIQPVERETHQAQETQPLVVLYSGNFGMAHDVDTVAQAMLTLRDDARVRFVFNGGGARRAALKAFCVGHGIGSAEFTPYVQRVGLGELLGAGDIGLVTQQDACCGAVVPSKIYGLLAAGRPVLFIGPAQATPARIIRNFGCGWHVPCGDSAAAARLLTHLAADREAVAAAGRAARAAAVAHYDLPLGVARVCALLGVFPMLSSTAKQHGETLGMPSAVIRQRA